MSLSAAAVGIVALAFAAIVAFGGTTATAFAATIVDATPATETSATLGVEAASVDALGDPVAAQRKLGAVVALAAAETPAQLLVPAKKRAVPKKVVRPVKKPTKPWAGPWKKATASWYGPGFYGRNTANGTTLTRSSMNVAHKTLKFGTRIQFKYRNKLVIAIVNDRGPFVRGREFDLGPGTAKALGFDGVGTVSYRIINKR